jgi:hypothetical protein
VRFLTTLVSIVLSTQQIAEAARPHTQAQDDYELGGLVGQCLVVKCQVFSGVISTEAAKSGKPIFVQVEETLFGTANKAETIAVPYEDENGDRRDGLGSPAAAWAKVSSVAKTTPVTVVFGLERRFGVYRGEPTLVVSNEREAEIVRALAAEARELENSPNLISEAIASLAHRPNPSLAGYLFVYLTLGKVVLPNDLTSALLSQLLGSPSVPTEQAEFIAAWLVFRYDHLSQMGKGALIRCLVDLGQRPDLTLAKAGYYGLARIASFDHSISAMIPQPSLASLESG